MSGRSRHRKPWGAVLSVSIEDQALRRDDDHRDEAHAQFYFAAVVRLCQSRLHRCYLRGRGSLWTVDDGRHHRGDGFPVEADRGQVESRHAVEVLVKIGADLALKERQRDDVVEL